MKAAGVYESLLDELVTGSFAPGQRLSENEISARYAVSRTPVREAIARLEHDGLLERVGSVLTVAAPGIEEILDLFDARISIEAHLAASAAVRHREGDLVALQAAANRARGLDDGAGAECLFIANRAFHLALRDAAHNRVLSELQRHLDLRVAALGLTTLSAPGRWKAVNREHNEVAAAVAGRDATRAAQVAGRHLRGARDLWLELVVAGRIRPMRSE